AERGKSKTKGAILLVGDVDYDADAGATVTVVARRKRVFRGDDVRWKGTARFEALQATRGEIATIQRTFHSVFEGGGVTTLEKEKGIPAAFRTKAPKHGYLHAATHGFFARPELRWALAGGDPSKAPTAISERMGQRPDVQVFPPGLLSGLVFAGVNKATADPD